MTGIQLVSQGAVAASGSPSFGQSTTAGNLLVAWVGSAGSTASSTIATPASGWVQADAGGAAFIWAAVWYKPNCGAGETAPVFTDPNGPVEYSQLAEYSGAATTSPVDQYGNGYSGGGNPFWEINTPPDADAGDLVAVAGFWNGANSGGTVTITQFTDSAGADITPTLQQSAAAGPTLYFSSLWGITGNTGGAGNDVFLNLSVFESGGGAMVSFKPASPVLHPLTVPVQALPPTWLDFPYSTRRVAATGGTPPYTWAVISGSLPAGLSLGASGATAGVLSGSDVSASGTFPFTAQVTDSAARTATGDLSVTVNPPPAGTSLTTTTSLTGNLGPYFDPAHFPPSTGFNTYVAANQVSPTAFYTQTLGAYDAQVFYVAADAAPAGTGQVQMGPCNSQQFTNWNSATKTWTGTENLPLSALASLTATFDVTDPLGGAYELEFDLWTGYVGGGGSATTVAAGSSGGQVSTIATWSSPSAGVLDVASAAGFPASGALLVGVSGGVQAFVTYTGTAGGNQFTGCAYVSGSATGTVSTGGFVCQPVYRDIIIWLDTSTERGTGGAILHTPDLTFGGLTYDFYYYPFPYPGGPAAGAELIFILQGEGGTGTFGHMTSGTVDLLGPLNWLIGQGFDLGNSGPPDYIPAAATPYLTLSLFGWEICNTDVIAGGSSTQTENFICNAFTYEYTLAGAPAQKFPAYSPAPANRAVTVPVRIGCRR